MRVLVESEVGSDQELLDEVRALAKKHGVSHPEIMQKLGVQYGFMTYVQTKARKGVPFAPHEIDALQRAKRGLLSLEMEVVPPRHAHGGGSRQKISADRVEWLKARWR